MNSQNTVKADTSAEAPKHTPWECDLVDCMVFNSRDVRVADCNNDEELISYEQQEANSRLIAAAPELLAALIAIRARVNGVFDKPELVAFGPLHPNAALDCEAIAAIAIAKAEGRT